MQKSSKDNTSTLYQGELTNVLWKYVKSGFLSKEMDGTLIPLGLNLIDEFYPMNLLTLDKKLKELVIPQTLVQNQVACGPDYSGYWRPVRAFWALRR